MCWAGLTDECLDTTPTEQRERGSQQGHEEWSSSRFRRCPASNLIGLRAKSDGTLTAIPVLTK